MSLALNRTIAHGPLGISTDFPKEVDPQILCPIERGRAREAIGICGGPLSFQGEDIWNCYEFSYLKPCGLPVAATLRISYPCTSINIIESKSLKLYLGGYAYERFDSADHIVARIRTDLSAVLHEKSVNLELNLPADWKPVIALAPAGKCLDNLKEVPMHLLLQSGTPDSALIKLGTEIISQKLYSNTFRALCPVTGQPDFATIYIEYTGQAIVEASLYLYLLSLRNHRGFHEECCERIFMDLSERAAPESLLVACHFTRRGGIDINPVRYSSNFAQSTLISRVWRQ